MLHLVEICLRHCATRREFTVSILLRVLGNIQVTFLMSMLRGCGVHAASNRNEYQGIFMGIKLQPAFRTTNFAVLVGSNVNVRMEAKNYIRPVGLQDLLRKSFTFTYMSSYTYLKTFVSKLIVRLVPYHLVYIHHH